MNLTALPAQAQSYNVLYTFTGGGDGAYPVAGLTMDKAGNLYGTAQWGGRHGQGTVFRLTRKASGWVLSPLYSFQGGNDGAAPASRVIFGPDGSLYGTTLEGGIPGSGCPFGCGTVFNLRPPPTACTTALCPWTETVLYRFTNGSDGGVPVGDLVFDQAGNLYGATLWGGVLTNCSGATCGLVYKLAPSSGSWTETVLYTFTGGSDGYRPEGGVIFDQAGNLYGTTNEGGAPSCGWVEYCGTVYELTPSGSGWTENTIFDFSTSAGKGPVGSLVFDTYGNLFGATALNNGPPEQKFPSGLVYEIKKSSNKWIEVYEDGLASVNPSGGVAADGAGNLYGVADDSGRGYTAGVVYEFSPSSVTWTNRALYVFTGGNDGGNPQGTVLPDANGNIYGTASQGGAGCDPFGCGVVWEITP